MVEVDRRERVRTQLLDRARDDERIVGAAITGSAASGREDRWSDIDLFLGVAYGIEVEAVLGDWSSFVYRELGALHHFDLRPGTQIYRAFLLDGPLEIDLGFTPGRDFGPVGGGGFQVVFGTPVERRALPPVDPGHLIGLSWHHVLHARIAIERGAPWQAEHWINAVRDHTITLACHRRGLPTSYAKGADALPPEVTGPIGEAFVRSLDTAELARALRAATEALLTELRVTDPSVFETLQEPLREIAGRR
ncbi:nucleotidyltransferase domain-containing protein [Pseudonocardia alaniniphila]|uniref:Nucleotidyltransferase domain-containing protein n=1 Tax=Pseudonocardia alaniniphila TaxID=75291 RepID=A0ABS9TL29_9PSEU|nr:nucleotidyltransferase domain-containing protein [Pseudonocardia alaniniphila]MCH6169252.1 nucleotidyltransferase domain-containing protein [Pseudonocardia alaniniphila]